jgi:deoxycytidylate deaminase
LQNADSEIVIGLVCPVGIDHKAVLDTLSLTLEQFHYRPNAIRVSELFPKLYEKLHQLWALPVTQSEQAAYKIQAGNNIREWTGRNDALAIAAANEIANGRTGRHSLPRTAHIIVSLKRPEEVSTLREIYGAGFFVIALSASRQQREEYFEERGMKGAADELIDKDAAESGRYGQQTRETFHLADVFVSMHDYRTQLNRFLDLIFGRPTLTPTPEEHAMFTAYAASLRSGDLSRQVGAAIVNEHGDILGVGCNEVPRPGGGLYGPDLDSHRDIEEGHDSNERAKEEMIQSVLEALGRSDLTKDEARVLLKPTGLTDITEFGRAVHAEMEALLACARTARSPRGATLYSTTFPCHNCCRHIIAAGIARVVYIEPYPKSRAPNLHGDAISIDELEPPKVPFQPFLGVGPRRYFDLFSLKLSTGQPLTRKEDGKLKPWSRDRAELRLTMRTDSYLDREQSIASCPDGSPALM